MRIKNTVEKSVEIAFRHFGELLKVATFKKITAYIPDPLTGATSTVISSAVVNYLPLHFSSRDVDGTTLIFGDEKWLVKASELESIALIPSSGDWFEIGATRYDYDVIAAVLDPTENLWTFQIRRNLPTPVGTVTQEDWGDLSLWTENEAWGNLALADSKENWDR
jgi:hypothetical protein